MDGEPPPPALVRAFDYKAWGVVLMDMPPGELRTVSLALNVYNALHGWYTSTERAKWQEKHPDLWADVVSPIIAERMARRSKRT